MVAEVGGMAGLVGGGTIIGVIGIKVTGGDRETVGRTTIDPTRNATATMETTATTTTTATAPRTTVSAGKTPTRSGAPTSNTRPRLPVGRLPMSSAGKGRR
eukprot:930790_1